MLYSPASFAIKYYLDDFQNESEYMINIAKCQFDERFSQCKLKTAIQTINESILNHSDIAVTSTHLSKNSQKPLLALITIAIVPLTVCILMIYRLWKHDFNNTNNRNE